MYKVLQTPNIESDQLYAAEGGFNVDVVTGKPMYLKNYHYVNLGGANDSRLVQSGKTTFYGGLFSNNFSGFKHVRLWDKATAPVFGTDVPDFTISIPGSWTREITVPPVVFQNGLWITLLSGSLADNATTFGLAAGDVCLDILYL
jgi:hypothetical protein